MRQVTLVRSMIPQRPEGRSTSEHNRQEARLGRIMPTGIVYHGNDHDRMLLAAGLKLGVPLARIAQEIGVSVPTLEKHYGDVISAAELRRGPKPLEPTEEQRNHVRMAAALGLPHHDIANLVGVSKGALEAHFRKELDTGKAQANFKVAGTLYKAATGPSNEKTTIIAAMFWAKTQMGWKETARVENTGAEGQPLHQPAKVVIMLPDNGRGDCTLPTVPYQPYGEETEQSNVMGSGFPDDDETD
jgi:hypothetical protein